MAETSSIVMLTGENHHEKLIGGLWNYFLFNIGVDFDVPSFGRRVQTHRLILDLFLSSDNLGECADPQMSDSSIEFLLEFLYRGQVAVPIEQLPNLLECALKSNFEMLVDAVRASGSVIVDDLSVAPPAVVAQPPAKQCFVSMDPLPENLQPTLKEKGFVGLPVLESLTESPVNVKFVAVIEPCPIRLPEPASIGLPEPLPFPFPEPGPMRSLESARLHLPEPVPLRLPQAGPIRWHQPAPNTIDDFRRRKDIDATHQHPVLTKFIKLEKPDDEPETDMAQVYVDIYQLTPTTQYSAATEIATGEPIPVELGRHHQQPPVTTTRGSTEMLRETDLNHENNKFSCNTCGFVFPSLADLDSHELGHGEVKFSCDDCDHEYQTLVGLNRHLQWHSDNPLKCGKCYKFFSCLATLKLHKADHAKDSFKCRKCDKFFKSRAALKYHMFDHAKYVFRCDKCVEPFYSSRALKCHEAHHEKDAFKCPKCDKFFPSLAALKYHEVDHQKNIFRCDKCEEPFYSSVALKRHEVFHEKSMFKCDKCGLQCPSLVALKYHESGHIKNGLRCNECDKLCPSIFALQRHQLHHHNLFKCGKCDQTFSSIEALQNHERYHEKYVFRCGKCDVVFLSMKALRSHQLGHEKNIFECGICDKLCSSLVALQYHEADHDKDLFKCEKCDKLCSSNLSLRRHQLDHSKKVFECSECDKMCSSLVHLRRHELEHNKSTFGNQNCVSNPEPTAENHAEQFHLCEFCGQSFAQLELLVRHARSHTPPLARWPFRCQVCPASFSSHDQLTSHQLSYSSNQPYSCAKCGKQFLLGGHLMRHLAETHRLRVGIVKLIKPHPLVSRLPPVTKQLPNKAITIDRDSVGKDHRSKPQNLSASERSIRPPTVDVFGTEIDEIDVLNLPKTDHRKALTGKSVAGSVPVAPKVVASLSGVHPAVDNVNRKWQLLVENVKVDSEAELVVFRSPLASLGTSSALLYLDNRKRKLDLVSSWPPPKK